MVRKREDANPIAVQLLYSRHFRRIRKNYDVALCIDYRSIDQNVHVFRVSIIMKKKDVLVSPNKS